MVARAKAPNNPETSGTSGTLAHSNNARFEAAGFSFPISRMRFRYASLFLKPESDSANLKRRQNGPVNPKCASAKTLTVTGT